MFEILSNFIEWYGTIAVLGAYGLAMFHVIPFQSPIFYMMNLSGAIALVVGSAFKRRCKACAKPVNAVGAGKPQVSGPEMALAF
jgi:hypothetical protein